MKDFFASSNLTVVVPTYNRATFLGECLNSLLSQTVPPSRVIVVDDGSTDATPQVVAGFARQIEYLRKENGGKSSALNLVLPLIQTEFVWFFDDDDVAHPWAIESHLAVHRDNPSLGFSFGFHDLGVSGPDDRIVIDCSPSPPDVFRQSIDAQRINLLRFCSFTLNACVIRTRLFREGIRFREALLRSQDYAAIIDLSQAASFAYTGSPTYIIRQHPGIRGSARSLHAHEDRRRTWMNFDRIIGKQVVMKLALERFLPVPAFAPISGTATRAALFGRAWVMASKCDIGQVVADLCSGCAADPATSLSREEVSLCMTLPDHPYFALALGDDLGRFLTVLSISTCPAGRQVLNALCRGLYRALRLKSDAFSNRSRVAVVIVTAAFLPFAIFHRPQRGTQ